MSKLQRISPAGWLLLGLLIGLGLSLYYAWVVNPVVYTDASPSRLSERYRAEYILLVSQNFAQDGDWPRAQTRLARLNDSALANTVDALLAQFVREQRAPEDIRVLALLARQMGVATQTVALFAPTPLPDLLPTPTIAPETAVSPTPTNTPFPTTFPSPTPLPTPTPTSTPDFNYRLLDQQRLCRPGEDTPLIVVLTQDAFLNDLPGVAVLVSWQNGADRFFTGFKPAISPGYGDFTMEPDISYTVVLAEGSPEVSGLRIEPCDDGRDGGWQLTFQNLRFAPTAIPETETTD